MKNRFPIKQAIAVLAAVSFIAGSTPVSFAEEYVVETGDEGAVYNEIETVFDDDFEDSENDVLIEENALETEVCDETVSDELISEDVIFEDNTQEKLIPEENRQEEENIEESAQEETLSEGETQEDVVCDETVSDENLYGADETYKLLVSNKTDPKKTLSVRFKNTSYDTASVSAGSNAYISILLPTDDGKVSAVRDEYGKEVCYISKVICVKNKGTSKSESIELHKDGEYWLIPKEYITGDLSLEVYYKSLMRICLKDSSGGEANATAVIVDNETSHLIGTEDNGNLYVEKNHPVTVTFCPKEGFEILSVKNMVNHQLFTTWENIIFSFDYDATFSIETKQTDYVAFESDKFSGTDFFYKRDGKQLVVCGSEFKMFLNRGNDSLAPTSYDVSFTVDKKAVSEGIKVSNGKTYKKITVDDRFLGKTINVSLTDATSKKQLAKAMLVPGKGLGELGFEGIENDSVIDLRSYSYCTFKIADSYNGYYDDLSVDNENFSVDKLYDYKFDPVTGKLTFYVDQLNVSSDTKYTISVSDNYGLKSTFSLKPVSNYSYGNVDVALTNAGAGSFALHLSMNESLEKPSHKAEFFYIVNASVGDENYSCIYSNENYASEKDVMFIFPENFDFGDSEIKFSAGLWKIRKNSSDANKQDVIERFISLKDKIYEGNLFESDDYNNIIVASGSLKGKTVSVKSPERVLLPKLKVNQKIKTFYTGQKGALVANIKFPETVTDREIDIADYVYSKDNRNDKNTDTVKFASYDRATGNLYYDIDSEAQPGKYYLPIALKRADFSGNEDSFVYVELNIKRSTEKIELKVPETLYKKYGSKLSTKIKYVTKDVWGSEYKGKISNVRYELLGLKPGTEDGFYTSAFKSTPASKYIRIDSKGNLIVDRDFTPAGDDDFTFAIRMTAVNEYGKVITSQVTVQKDNKEVLTDSKVTIVTRKVSFAAVAVKEADGVYYKMTDAEKKNGCLVYDSVKIILVKPELAKNGKIFYPNDLIKGIPLSIKTSSKYTGVFEGDYDIDGTFTLSSQSELKNVKVTFKSTDGSKVTSKLSGINFTYKPVVSFNVTLSGHDLITEEDNEGRSIPVYLNENSNSKKIDVQAVNNQLIMNVDPRVYYGMGPYSYYSYSASVIGGKLKRISKENYVLTFSSREATVTLKSKNKEGFTGSFTITNTCFGAASGKKPSVKKTESVHFGYTEYVTFKTNTSCKYAACLVGTQNNGKTEYMPNNIVVPVEDGLVTVPLKYVQIASTTTKTVFRFVFGDYSEKSGEEGKIKEFTPGSKPVSVSVSVKKRAYKFSLSKTTISMDLKANESETVTIKYNKENAFEKSRTEVFLKGMKDSEGKTNAFAEIFEAKTKGDGSLTFVIKDDVDAEKSKIAENLSGYVGFRDLKTNETRYISVSILIQ